MSLRSDGLMRVMYVSQLTTHRYMRLFSVCNQRPAIECFSDNNNCNHTNNNACIL